MWGWLFFFIQQFCLCLRKKFGGQISVFFFSISCCVIFLFFLEKHHCKYERKLLNVLLFFGKG